MVDLLSLDQKDMVDFVSAHGFPAFRGRQLFQWCHEKSVFDFGRMTDLPKDFRAFLEKEAFFDRGELLGESLSDDGETAKFLLRFGDDCVETVLMRYDRMKARNRATLCVSTQVGCAMGCKFCATGQGGLVRNLSVGNILDQLNHANAYLKSRGERPVSNVVYMGMGEPFANYEAVLKSVRLINAAKGIGMRRITISTCGLIPEIDRLAKEDLQLTLAVSLHGANEPLRSRLMPINKRYPLAELMAALDRYIEATGRRVTVEYALFDGVNDRRSDADALADLLAGKLYHVNLVPGNPVCDTGLKRSSAQKIAAFAARLEKRSVPVSIRESKGNDIDGACGQLRARHRREK